VYLSLSSVHRVYEFDGQSRFVVNAVTLGDFEAPLRISTFAKEVFTGFTIVRELRLSLENDTNCQPS
jgi:hypothetical protein